MHESAAVSNFFSLTNPNVQKSCRHSAKSSPEPVLRFIAFCHIGFICPFPPLVYT